MLQPAQLNAVLSRYGREVAEMRTFLEQAGINVGATTAMAQIAQRATQDRAFHRDLMSNVWVMLDLSGSTITYADLLGIVAVAAAGVGGGSRTDERDAHALLRFLMEARHALELAMVPVAGTEEPAVAGMPTAHEAPNDRAALTQQTPRRAVEQSPEPVLPHRSSQVTTARPMPLPRAVPPQLVESSAAVSEERVSPQEVAPAAETAAAPLTSAETKASASGGWQAPDSRIRRASTEKRAVASAKTEHLLLDEERPSRDRVRRRLVYAASGACVLALVGVSYSLLRPTAPETRTAPIVAAPDTAHASGMGARSSMPADTNHGRDARAPDEGNTLPAAGESAIYSRPQRADHIGVRPVAPGALAPSQRFGGGPMDVRSAPIHAGGVPSATAVEPYNTASAAPVAGRAGNTGTPANSSGRPATPATAADSNMPKNAYPQVGSNIVIRTARPGVPPSAVSTATLSRQLGSPTMPDYGDDAGLDSNGKRRPRLLRRKAGSDLAEPADAHSDIAMNHMPNLGVGGAGRATSSGTSSGALAGTVRSTCIGMMAGNLMFSPVPAYPQAAAVARVQGQVKVQATVDRDGSVNSARVVSGPPQLRDAALDAVQHWRYKPYMAGGKAAPTGTTAVFEFELQ